MLSSLEIFSSMSQRASPAKNWCFTSFAEESPKYDAETMAYLVFQREECPETKRRHWQGYLQLKTKSRLASVKKLIADPAAHWEVARGTATECQAYCMKVREVHRTLLLYTS